AGTDDGVFCLRNSSGTEAFRSVDLGPEAGAGDFGVTALLGDRRGALWIGKYGELFRLLPDGHTEHYTTRQGLVTDGILCILEDSEGRIWIGSRQGLYMLVAEPNP